MTRSSSLRLHAYATEKMKFMLILFLPASVTAAANAHSRPSSAPRSFRSFIEKKIRNVGDEVLELKQELKECCNQAGCTYDKNTYAHGSIFTAADNCNICMCQNGTVDCTNSTGCGQSTDESSSYSYSDQIAQGYCASGSGDLEAYVSAVRRDCQDPAAPTCTTICQKNNAFASNFTSLFPESEICMPGENIQYYCRGGLWFWMDHPSLSPNRPPGQTDAGLLNMVTISYDQNDGCSATGCGPNYCCCVAYCVD